MNRQTVAQSQQKVAPQVQGGILQRKCACGQHAGGGKCEECQKKKQSLQRKRGSGAEPVGVPPIVHEVLRSPGEGLEPGVRGFMESRFGHEFSQVRVHHDVPAAASALAVGALAYTVGRHVVFGESQFRPENETGRRLLTHELVHVIQQERTGLESPISARAALEVGSPHDAFEQEAEALEVGALAKPAPSALRSGAGPRIQRAGVGNQKPVEKLSEEMLRQIAWDLREAMKGLGTDENAIYSAFAGRTQEEVDGIERMYRAMFQRDLLTDLRDELTESEMLKLGTFSPTLFQRAGSSPAEQSQALADTVAVRLQKAMYRLGTDEKAIFAALTGRTQSELEEIKKTYKRLTGHKLEADLQDELSGADLQRAMQLLMHGVLEPEDQIRVATAGLGTDEDRLFAILESMKGDPATIQATIDAYRRKGYGEMLEDIREDLAGRDLDRAMELLHGTTKTDTCSSGERRIGLVAISKASSLATTTVSVVSSDSAKGKLSEKVEAGLKKHFNPGGAANVVTVALAQRVSNVLSQSAQALLSRNEVTCSTPLPMPCGSKDPCVPDPNCASFSGAWTCPSAGSIVRLCPAFFICADDHDREMLHEFVHHSGIDDKFYFHQAGYQSLTPSGDGASTDSLDNADSYASFAADIA